MSSGKRRIKRSHAARPIERNLSSMREPRQFPTVFARNLYRIMVARGWNPRSLSLAARLSKGYVTDVLSGKIRVPGTEASNALADVLQCASDDLTRDAEPSASPDQARHRMNRRRALDAAEHAMGEDGDAEHATLVYSTAEMIYGLIVEREATLGRPIEDDDEDFWRLLDSMARRWMADRR
jgi:transcriptional regulator with XRE-family HTH domain